MRLNAQEIQETGENVQIPEVQATLPDNQFPEDDPEETEVQPLEDEATVREVTANDIKRGERLFKGLISTGPDAASCVSCHNTLPVDSFNWNPSTYEISRLYRDRDVAALKTVVNEAMTGKMLEAHSGYQFNDEELFQMKAYMDDFSLNEPTDRPVITKTLIFIGLLLIVLLMLADLIILKTIPYKFLHLAVILTSGYFIVDMVAFEAVSLGRSPYYEPDQPIKFSHQVHSLDNRTDCLYCHSIAEYSTSAGIPATSQCMNCHIIVREGTHSGRFEINKLIDAFDNEESVRWIRVHSLPHHVKFSHAQHTASAGLDCAECHGDVENMDRIMQVNDLSMGWCLDCHRTTEVDILNNEFYSDYIHLREDLRGGRIDVVTARETGGTDCMKCHY